MATDEDEDEIEDDLWNAATEGALDRVARFLEKLGATTPDFADEFGFTPLMAAVQYGHVELARALLDRGADPNFRDVEGQTSVHHCDTPECLRLLAERGADLEAADDDGLTALATRRGELRDLERDGASDDEEERASVAKLVKALEAALGARGGLPLHQPPPGDEERGA